MADSSKDSDVKGRQDERNEGLEALKINFELCKHLTTLSSAVTVVLLTVHRDVAFKADLFGWVLALFGLSVIFSVYGMINIAGRVEREAKVGNVASILVFLASVTFLGGLGIFMVYASDTPHWLISLLGGVFLISLIFARTVEVLSTAKPEPSGSLTKDSEEPKPPPATGEAQEGVQRPWWRRMFGG